MEPKFTQEIARTYHFRFKREYRAVTVLWGLLSIIWCILNVVTFVQPQWIGDTKESPGYGHMGVFQYCYPDNNKETYLCSGSFTDFETILSDAFKACTFFVGVSALLMLIVVANLLLFFCFKKTAVFVFSGILQIFSALFMFLACVIYPVGWNHGEVETICGEGADEYRLGDCSIRWAYILAILGVFDAAVLGVLAFFLAAKRPSIGIYTTTTVGTVTKSELNGYSETMSKRSMPIQPHMMAVPEDRDAERYSEYSQPSQRGGISNRGFQL